MLPKEHFFEIKGAVHVAGDSSFQSLTELKYNKYGKKGISNRAYSNQFEELQESNQNQLLLSPSKIPEKENPSKQTQSKVQEDIK